MRVYEGEGRERDLHKTNIYKYICIYASRDAGEDVMVCVCERERDLDKMMIEGFGGR